MPSRNCSWKRVPHLPLRGVIEVPRAAHHRRLTGPELGAFWRSVERKGVRFVTIAWSKLLPHRMCRKSEVLRVRWRGFDLDRRNRTSPPSA